MSRTEFSCDAWRRYTADGDWFYEIEDAGYKYNMTDIAAALGLVELSRAEELLNARRSIASAYHTGLTASNARDLLELPIDAEDGSHAWGILRSSGSGSIGCQLTAKPSCRPSNSPELG